MRKVSPPTFVLPPSPLPISKPRIKSSPVCSYSYLAKSLGHVTEEHVRPCALTLYDLAYTRCLICRSCHGVWSSLVANHDIDGYADSSKFSSNSR